MSGRVSSSQTPVLIEGCQGLVRSIAWKIHQRLPAHVELEELIAYGQLGLIEAAQRFSEDRGTRFATFAYYRIRGAIFDGLSEMAWFKASAYHEGRYERLAGDLLETDSQDNADDPEDLSSNARWLTETGTRLAVVSIMSMAGGTDAAASLAVDRGGDRPDQSLQLRELVQALHDLIKTLPDQQRELVQLSYFDGLTLKEAGERIGVSKSWASRLHDRALRALSEGLIKRGVA